MVFSKSLKLKIQTWVTNQQSLIYFSFQFILISAVFLIYPGMETLIVVILWVHFSGFCYLLYTLEVPVVFVTGVALATFRVLTLLYNNTPLVGILVLLSILIVFLIINRTVKKVAYIKKSVDEFSANESIIATHFNEMQLIGSLGMQVDFCLLLLGYAFFFEGSNLFCLINTQWYSYLPCSFLLGISFAFITFMEHLICVCFNQTYGFKFANQVFRLTRRVMSIGGATFVGYTSYENYAVGGWFDPNLRLPFIKSMQMRFLGANADSAEGVRLLRKFKLLGQGNPPCMEGTTLVDTDQIKHLIKILDKKHKMYDELLNKNLSELSENFVYDKKLSAEENRKRFFEAMSPPDITNDDCPHEKVKVGIRPSDDPFPGKKKGK